MINKNLPHNHGKGLEHILEKMPQETAFENAANSFAQLSDATRLKIVWLLCHSEECVTNIAAAVEMSNPAVSHHLRVLKNSGIIKNRRIGKEVYYTLENSPQNELIHQMIDDMFEVNCPGCGIR